MLKNIVIACGMALVPLAASAQMPVPLLDGSVSAQARKQLEGVLLCKKGTTFTAKTVEAQLESLGLAKGTGGILLPARAGTKAVLFDDEVIAALVSDADGEKKASVYLKKKNAKQLAKQFGVSQVDEQANTDEESYFKQNGNKNTLLVGAESELDIGNPGQMLKYKSSVTCQVIQ